MTAIGRLSPLSSALTCPIVMSALRPKADAQSARVRIALMSAFPKADVQNFRVGTELYVCFWPKVSVKELLNMIILNVPLAPESGRFLR